MIETKRISCFFFFKKMKIKKNNFLLVWSTNFYTKNRTVKNILSRLLVFRSTQSISKYKHLHPLFSASRRRESDLLIHKLKTELRSRSVERWKVMTNDLRITPAFILSLTPHVLRPIRHRYFERRRCHILYALVY